MYNNTSKCSMVLKIRGEEKVNIFIIILASIAIYAPIILIISITLALMREKRINKREADKANILAGAHKCRKITGGYITFTRLSPGIRRVILYNDRNSVLNSLVVYSNIGRRSS